MKTVGIICEYNPFHTGHEHQINRIKKGGDVTVVCLMSGNATQRGELAVTDKFTRAAAALAGGADLVLELPFPYSAAGAEFFSAAGVTLLDAIGVDEINFGSESADATLLCAAAKITCDTEFSDAYEKKLSDHPSLGTAAAYFETLRDFGIDGEIRSNDILGISYFRAAIRTGCEKKLTVTKREGADYSETVANKNIHPSATALRELIKRGDSEAFSFMPERSAEIMKTAEFADTELLTAAILAFFRLSDGDALASFAEAGGGLSHRLCTAAREATSLDEFFRKAASKRYTDSRVRRAVLNCLLGVTPDDLRTTPAYLQLLAANSRGRALLTRLKKSSALPVVTKPADAPECRESELSRRLDALYALAFAEAKPASEYIKRSPFIDFQEND